MVPIFARLISESETLSGVPDTNTFSAGEFDEDCDSVPYPGPASPPIGLQSRDRMIWDPPARGRRGADADALCEEDGGTARVMMGGEAEATYPVGFPERLVTDWSGRCAFPFSADLPPERSMSHSAHPHGPPSWSGPGSSRISGEAGPEPRIVQRSRWGWSSGGSIPPSALAEHFSRGKRTAPNDEDGSTGRGVPGWLDHRGGRGPWTTRTGNRGRPRYGSPGSVYEVQLRSSSAAEARGR